MANPQKTRNKEVVSIPLGSDEGIIERVQISEDEEGVKVYKRRKGSETIEPVTLSEDELLELLQRAIHAGVLSSEFVGQLHNFIEI
jgi:hypothetical protein